MLIWSLVPWLESCSTEIDAVEEKLESFRREFDTTLAGFAGSRPTESAFFEAFCSDPEASSVKIKKLDAVAALVGEYKKRTSRAGGAEAGPRRGCGDR